MLKELKCNKCGRFYHTDQVSSIYCPKCVDPRAIPGCTYLKETILNLLRRQLQLNGVDTAVFAREDLISMLQSYPRASSIFHSNDEFRTVTIPPGTIFPGGKRDFTIGVMTNKHKGRRTTFRDVGCTSCDKHIFYPSNRVFRWYLGFEKKWCRKCDFEEYASWKRNTSGLKKGGTIDPNSLRSRARALNVSRSQMRMNPPSERVPHLPIGTMKKTLMITEAFWDERVEAPRYRLICVKCNRYFVIPQRDWNNCDHSC